MEKDFEVWHKFKAKLQINENLQIFKESEIWWCSIGLNIGSEEDGKSHKFSRPVLIVKKFNNKIFWAVPLTTVIKENPHYYKINFQDRNVCAMLSQLKMLDCKRLAAKMGKLSNNQMNGVKQALSKMLLT